MLTVKSLRALPVAVALLAAGTAWAEDDAHWSYSGDDGPDKWGALSKAYAACSAGRQQSPIDISDTVDARLMGIELAWRDAEWEVINNGHTVQVQASGAGHAIIAGARFELLQFHFHAPSEHAVAGRRAPMEAHFVHRHESGALAVIGVMMQGGGGPGPFDEIMARAPSVEGGAPLGRIAVRALLPDSAEMFRYQGSLTTPPCSEIVLWSVMSEPVAVSDAAIEAFRNLFPMNARPLQPLNRRYVLK